MICPKCGFTEAREPSCERCGVVFAKLAAGRPARPTSATSARPAPRLAPRTGDVPSGFSIVNVLLLTVCAGVLVVAGWYVARPQPEEKAPERERRSLVAAEGGSEDAAPRPVPDGGALVLPGLEREAPSADVAPPPSVKIEVPRLNPRAVTPEEVQQIAAASDQNPGMQDLRAYAARAYLFLAHRQVREKRGQEALLTLAAAKRFGPDAGEYARTHALAYASLRDFNQAQPWAQSALASGPDAEMYDVLGNYYYLREEVPQAIEAWKSSLSVRENPTVRAALERALQENAVEGGLDEKRLAHFIVKYEGETMEDTGRLVLGSLERSYTALKSFLGFEPTERIVVILLTRQDYAELGGPHWSAGYFDGKVRVPVRGLSSLDRHVENTLRHELTHAFLYARAGGDCPRWLQEGMAEYAEGSRSAESAKELAQSLDKEDTLVYCLATNNYCDPRYFYPAATAVVEYLIANRGMGGIRDLLSMLGEGKSIDDGLRKLMGRDQQGLLKDWAHFMKRRNL